MHKLPRVQKRARALRTFVKHTLLNILALSKIDESLDKCETADDLLTQYMELFAHLALQSPHRAMYKRSTYNQLRGDIGGEGRETGAPTPATRSAARR